MAEKKLKSRKGANGKWGYVDENEKWVIEPKFIVADEFERGVARVQLDWLWGFLKDDGTWLFEPVLHDAEPFYDEIAKVRKGFFYGFINRNGEWFIEPKLLWVFKCENDPVIIVKNLEGKYAYISNKGKMITDFNCDNLGSYGEPIMSDDRILACKDEKYGFLDMEGNWIVPPVYAKAWDYSEERAFVSGENVSNYVYYMDMIDLSGEVIKKSVHPVSHFKNGMAIVEMPIGEGENKSYKSGVMDREGNWIVPPRYDKVEKFKDGYAIVWDNDREGVIDEKGNDIIPLEYKTISACEDYFKITDEKNKVGLANREGKIIISPKYSNCWVNSLIGLIEIENKGKYGLADLNGKVILKPTLGYISSYFVEGKYLKVETKDGKSGWMDIKGNLLGSQWFDGTKDFSEGLAAVKINDLWGFIDPDGKIVIEPQFDEVIDFKNGISIVNVSNHWGLIDKKGDWLVDPKFDEIKKFSNGIAPAKIFNPKARSSKWGFIDEKANFVINPEFDELKKFVDGFANAKSNGKWGVIDKNGNWIISPLYDEIGEFSEAGMAQVKIKNKIGLISQDGKEIVPVQITKIGSYHYSSIGLWVKINNKWGFLDTNEGKWIIEPKYEDLIEESSGNFFSVKIDGKWGRIDFQSNWLIAPLFDSYDNFNENMFLHGLKRGKIDGKEVYYDVIANKLVAGPSIKKDEDE